MKAIESIILFNLIFEDARLNKKIVRNISILIAIVAPLSSGFKVTKLASDKIQTWRPWRKLVTFVNAGYHSTILYTVFLVLSDSESKLCQRANFTYLSFWTNVNYHERRNFMKWNV